MGDFDAGSALFARVATEALAVLKGNLTPNGRVIKPSTSDLARQKHRGKAVRDMVRISDARMSGTCFGTCVLHVSPEAWIGDSRQDLIRILPLQVSPQRHVFGSVP